MKEEPDIDELLSGYIDGELSPREQTEVRRLIANEPEVAQRLQQLKKCSRLVTSLPFNEAPAGMVERVKVSLETRVPLFERRVLEQRRGGARQLMFRKVLSAAAMLALVAMLGAVVYIIMSPGPIKQPVAFAGRLELETTDLAASDLAIRKAIEDNQLADFTRLKGGKGKYIYTITCSRDRINSFLSDLEGVWGEFDSATLFVQTKMPGGAVEVRDVNTEKIIHLITPPMPKVTGGDQETTIKRPLPRQDEKKVQLTIEVLETG